MTRYAGTESQPHDRGDGVMVYANGDDWPSRFVVTGYDYTPADPNPDDCPEFYRPVTLEWSLPANEPFGVVTLHQAVNGWRANRTYKITTPGATNTYGVMVNGVHIPVEFYSVHDAKLFAQHIEDSNTED